ncbi:hypothetical protein EWB00_005771 [Schistosoma japonicum]|uniref:Uncharacterized protein n=1 Tax=Schistosoma japonicum TaxID=6182 RepID=A0A4Z2D0N0_SCHJA|nr:hypothetical protein EWB00_005771 [Schistosoma japonicum]
MTYDVDPVDVQYQTLTTWNVAGAFIVTAVFTGISLFLLLVEYVWHKWGNNKDKDECKNNNDK